jgi:sugar fermentation stimulation protein A
LQRIVAHRNDKGILPVRLPPLTPGVLLRRYKRFLADVEIGAETVTAHCPNTGSMLGCSEPGRTVHLSRHDSAKRKHVYTWELINMETSLVGVNTARTNAIVREALEEGKIPNLSHYDKVRSEVKLGRGTRIDLLLQGPDVPDYHLEVKNCTLVRNETAEFPDAASDRGRKHLQELTRLCEAGRPAGVFFLVQRMDARSFRPAREIDPEYARLLRRGAELGLQVHAYDATVELSGIRVRNALPCRLRA